MRRDLYEGGYTLSNTSVKENVGLSAEEPIRGGWGGVGGGRAYRRRNTVFKDNLTFRI